jgi:aminopeptidase C
MPQKFTYNGKEYTPKSYAESLGLNKNDFISFTSFTHHPFYEKMVIDVPDNWRWTKSYNIPLDEMLEIMDYAIENGYTVGWVADMSEKSWGDVATIPDFEANDKQITQEIRQIAYDNKETTDDHAMHVYGISKDQNGTKYYMVKNSFGNAGAYNGHNYASESYVRYKTMNILVNKAAVPAHILKKLGM